MSYGDAIVGAFLRELSELRTVLGKRPRSAFEGGRREIQGSGGGQGRTDSTEIQLIQSFNLFLAPDSRTLGFDLGTDKRKGRRFQNYFYLARICSAGPLSPHENLPAIGRPRWSLRLPFSAAQWPVAGKRVAPALQIPRRPDQCLSRGIFRERGERHGNELRHPVPRAASGGSWRPAPFLPGDAGDQAQSRTPALWLLWRIWRTLRPRRPAAGRVRNPGG